MHIHTTIRHTSAMYVSIFLTFTCQSTYIMHPLIYLPDYQFAYLRIYLLDYLFVCLPTYIPIMHLRVTASLPTYTAVNLPFFPEYLLLYLSCYLTRTPTAFFSLCCRPGFLLETPPPARAWRGRKTRHTGDKMIYLGRSSQLCGREWENQGHIRDFTMSGRRCSQASIVYYYYYFLSFHLYPMHRYLHTNAPRLCDRVH